MRTTRSAPIQLRLPQTTLATLLSKWTWFIRNEIAYFSLWLLVSNGKLTCQKIYYNSMFSKTVELFQFYIWIYMPQDPNFWITDPIFCGQLKYELCSGFWCRNEELKVPVFRGWTAMTLRSGKLYKKLHHIRVARTINPSPHTSEYPLLFLSWFTSPNLTGTGTLIWS